LKILAVSVSNSILTRACKQLYGGESLDARGASVLCVWQRSSVLRRVTGLSSLVDAKSGWRVHNRQSPCTSTTAQQFLRTAGEMLSNWSKSLRRADGSRWTRILERI